MSKDKPTKIKKLAQKVFDHLNESELSYLAVQLRLTTWRELYTGAGKKGLKKLLSTEEAATALASFQIPEEALERMSDAGINYVTEISRSLQSGEPLPEWEGVVETTKERLEAGEDGVMSRLRRAKGGPRKAAAKKVAPKVEEPEVEETEVEEEAAEEEAPKKPTRTRARRGAAKAKPKGKAAPRRRARPVKKAEPEPEPEEVEEAEPEDEGEADEAPIEAVGSDLGEEVAELRKEVALSNERIEALVAANEALTEQVGALTELVSGLFGAPGEEPASPADISYFAYNAQQNSLKTLAAVAGMVGLEVKSQEDSDAVEPEDMAKRGVEFGDGLFGEPEEE